MTRHIANSFTLLNLIFGCIAILFILNGFAVADETLSLLPEKIYWATFFICLAGVVDFLDGLIARILNASSEMGKQLDSLADLVSFGVAPGLIIFQFLKLAILKNHPDWSNNVFYLLPALLLPCAGAYRLARFNLNKTKSLNFEGMPIPASGIFIAAFPLLYQFSPFLWVQLLLENVYFWYAVVLICSFLMVSKLPMISLKFKNSAFKSNWPKFVLIIFTLILIPILKWLAIPIVFIFYIIISLCTLGYKSD